MNHPVRQSPSIALRFFWLALLLLIVPVTSPSSAQTAPTSATSVTSGSRSFEMRTYYAHQGKMADLHARFRNHTSGLFRKHGMEIVGYWVPVEQPDVLVYILAYKDRAAAGAAWKGFQDDPEWQKAKAASEAAGPLVAKIESRWLEATDYSPVR
jgi:NIPSNAP